MTQIDGAKLDGGQGGNTIDFLDVILCDFACLESETSADDDQQAASHERFTDDSNEDKAAKTTAMNHKTRQREQIEELIRNLKKELSLTHHKTSQREQTEEFIRNLKKELSLTQQELDAATRT